MYLPDHAGLVARLAQFAGQGGFGLPRHAAGHADHAVDTRRLTGHEHAARGNAGRRLGVAATEARTGGTDPVHARRLQDRVVGDAQRVVALLVGHDQQDVGLFAGHCALR